MALGWIKNVHVGGKDGSSRDTLSDSLVSSMTNVEMIELWRH